MNNHEDSPRKLLTALNIHVLYTECYNILYLVKLTYTLRENENCSNPFNAMPYM